MMELNKIICGDALEELKKFPDESIDMCITSPPYYGLRNYGVDGQIGLEKTFDEFLEKMLAITAEIKRVLKKTGSFYLNMGDCYGIAHENGTRDIDTGWRNEKSIDRNIKLKGRASGVEKCLLMQPERLAIAMCDQQEWILRNKIKWAKQVLIKGENKTIGSVMPTSVKDRFNESGEELYFFVKNKKYYSSLDEIRIAPQSELNLERPRMGQGNETIYEQKRGPDVIRNRVLGYDTKFKFNYRVRDAERKAGQPQFTASPEEIERYKQNYIDDDKGARRTRTKLHLHLRHKSEKQNAQPEGRSHFQTGKALHDFVKEKYGSEQAYRETIAQNGKNIPTIWQINPEPHNFKIDHFAIFPQALVEIPIKFSCPPKGVVLDPFCGSGTTCVVARALGRNYLGIELNPDYIKMAEKRLAQNVLF